MRAQLFHHLVTTVLSRTRDDVNEPFTEAYASWQPPSVPVCVVYHLFGFHNRRMPGKLQRDQSHGTVQDR